MLPPESADITLDSKMFVFCSLFLSTITGYRRIGMHFWGAKIEYRTPFNFRPPLIFGRGWPKIRGAEKVEPFFGWPKTKGAEIFPKHLYNS